MSLGQDIMQKLVNNIENVMVGKRESIEFITIALACNSHVLVEDVPGVGKTTLITSLAKSMKASFKRIQFTPDVMPSDITGFSMYHPQKNEFEYMEGAIMANVVLADEINRTPPKTQASLLEAMEERQVTVDGHTYKLPYPFIVMATQNPIEYLGTYPLPEAQLDRFMLKISIGYPDKKQETNILRRFEHSRPDNQLLPVVDCDEIIQLHKLVKEIFISDELCDYIVSLVEKTRHRNDILLGGSPRASLYIMNGAKAWALYQGREFVTPDDIKKCFIPVMSHRVILRNEVKFDNITTESVLYDILKTTIVPIIKK